MRFGKMFQRGVSVVGSHVLGTETNPPTGHPNDSANDNQMSSKLSNINGFPIQRIAVGYNGPGGAFALSAKLFIWDDLSEKWYLADTQTMQPGAITWFDQPTLGDSSARVSAGCLDVCLVVAAAGSDPVGTYTFTMGADLSNTT